MRRAVLAFLAVGLVATGCTDSPESNACRDQGADGKGFECEVDGDKVPDLPFTRFDGSTASLHDYEGSPLLINFFASTCVPCVREMPAIEDLHQEYGNELVVLGLAVNDRVEDAQELVDQTGVTYDLGLDPRSEVITGLGGVALPTTVLVTAEGAMVALHTGDLKPDELGAFVRDKLFPA